MVIVHVALVLTGVVQLMLAQTMIALWAKSIAPHAVVERLSLIISH
jgi:hypothetical protein